LAKHRGHNEGSIYQRKDGRWCGAVIVGRDATGKLRRRYVYGDTRKEVREKLARLMADAQSGLPVDVSRQTVGEFLTHWLEDTVKGSARPSTYDNYRTIIRLHVIPAIGSVPLAKLTPQHLQHLYHEKQEAGLTRTVVLMHAVIHKALSQAVKWGLVPRNVADAVERPRVRRKEFRALEPQEARRFLAAAAEDRLFALYVLAVTCGLRQGELLGLKWEDVNLEQGTLTVRRQLQWRNGGFFFAEPKSAKSRRTVPLPATAITALKRHRKQQAAERLGLGDGWQDYGLVFTTEIGTPLNPSNIRNRSFDHVLDKAGLPHIRFHDLRHTCATLLLAQGVHPKLVQEQLGHSQISVTLDTYSHVTAPMMKEAAAKMDAILNTNQA